MKGSSSPSVCGSGTVSVQNQYHCDPLKLDFLLNFQLLNQNSFLGTEAGDRWAPG